MTITVSISSRSAFLDSCALLSDKVGRQAPPLGVVGAHVVLDRRAILQPLAQAGDHRTLDRVEVEGRRLPQASASRASLNTPAEQRPDSPAEEPAAPVGTPKLYQQAYATFGQWKVESYSHDPKGGNVAYCQATKIFASETALRFVSNGQGGLSVDFMGDSTGALGNTVKVSYWIDAPAADGSIATARLVTDPEGGEWLRITEPDDGPGVEDGLANAKTFTIKSKSKQWRYALAGTNPVVKSLFNCVDKLIRKL